MIYRTLRLAAFLLAGALIAGPVMAQNQNQNPNSFRGIVIGAADDRNSFTIVDRSGRIVAIRIGASTSFDANRTPSNFAGAVAYGMDIRGTYALDGSAATVSARGQASEIEDEQLQAFMAVADEEWAILKPKIDRAQVLLRVIEGDNLGGGNNNGQNAPAQRNPVRELQRSLQTGFFNLSVNAAQLRSNLMALRQERTRARAELTQIRGEIQGLVTTRQEVLLVVMGILE